MNYARVLPELSRHYHVFAVDCYGHGASARAPERYSASAIGGDLAQFIQDVVGEPAVISGHSSGGLVTIWLAAYAPEEVRGVILEDPPIFTTLLPRATSTWNYLDLATTAHNFLQSGENDFVAYYAEHARFWTFFGDLRPMLIRDMLAYHNQHPQDAVKIYYMPPVLNEIFRGFTHYDPQFGEAFYTGTWDTNFDHADALTRITVPAVLIHTNWSYNSDGILLAAMDADDAERARSLLHDVVFIKVDSGHGFHFEKPGEFIQILLNFQSRLES
jgi:pimeloyl-ACP methyl ester carboxylesterase